jgi:predicted nucleic acid-binding protein
LRYLAVVGGLDWLPALFGEVVCPPEVLAECRHAHAPVALRAWASSVPSWLRVVSVPEGARALPVDGSLDAGEAAALRLAREIGADLVLLDERRGRVAAARLGLVVAGTLGVFVEAALRGLVDFEAALALLTTRTNLRVSDSVVSAARARLAAGRRGR